MHLSSRDPESDRIRKNVSTRKSRNATTSDSGVGRWMTSIAGAGKTEIPMIDVRYWRNQQANENILGNIHNLSLLSLSMAPIIKLYFSPTISVSQAGSIFVNTA